MQIHSFLLTVCSPDSIAEEIHAKRSNSPEVYNKKVRLEVRPRSSGYSIHSPKRLCTMKTAECHMRVFKSVAGGTWREKQTDRQAAPLSAVLSINPLAFQC